MMPGPSKAKGTELAVIESTALAPQGPKPGELQKWTQERLCEDAVELYGSFISSLKQQMKPYTMANGDIVMPSVKIMELAADVLKLRDTAGININQNFGSTTINNGGTNFSPEDILRWQAERDSKPVIIDVEVIEDAK